MSGGVILFHTTAMAMKAEKVLTRAGYTVRLVPTPREYSSDCGIAIRFSAAGKELITGLLDSGGVEIATLHEL
jgi:hypothetical protein